MKYSIYINEAKFTADEDTLDKVEDALSRNGFIFDQSTEGWISKNFYSHA
jgi:hypothetical protein